MEVITGHLHPLLREYAADIGAEKPCRPGNQHLHFSPTFSYIKLELVKPVEGIVSARTVGHDSHVCSSLSNAPSA